MARFRVCPLGGTGVGGKWMFWSMYHLLDGARRFSELRRLMPEANRQTLVTQLRELERGGAVRRKVSLDVPPRVEYSLTRLGRESEPILRQLHDWGEWFGGQVGCEVDWLSSLGGRWKVWIVHQLFDGPRRFTELRRLLPPISNQVLARELRELDGLGLVRRLPAPQAAYALTAAGSASVPMFRQLYAWGRWTSAQTGVTFDWPVDTPPEPLRLVNTRQAIEPGSGRPLWDAAQVAPRTARPTPGGTTVSP
ncbi:winged helix-turn-helix transcriptional regulator [Micromonospora sp. DR5-3]|uniref:winged helix-turn-helix transcriptional regulator n=1 Tax=unclassified Micromonospora TaxID=2617518 RepID=UPI001CA33CC7|nr:MULTISPECIES: winged helix-turn-helix transcriptional regulator [unclassified Micromonospora]MCW3814735.1 winged helix-turn-helix transcriptional regulator [Micromonospora sp. DR5-3]